MDSIFKPQLVRGVKFLPMAFSSHLCFHFDSLSIVSSAGRGGAKEEDDCIDPMVIMKIVIICTGFIDDER